MTKFKAMSMDEKVQTIEQITQESVRVREENRGVEESEARRRGILLLEESQRYMKRLEEYPPLNPFIEPLRITPSDTRNHGEELNGSETIPPEETTDQENPIPMSPQTRSSVTTTAQRRTTRESSGTGMPTILIDLITIYDDE
jgi:hypothetical protein